MSLESELDSALAEVRAAFPDIAISDEQFRVHLAREENVASLHLLDLFLACACAHGDARALEAFDRRYRREIERVLERLRVPSSMRDDVVQQIMETLFIGAGDRTGKIADYRGRGPLQSWLRVSTLRAAYKALRKAGTDIAAGDEDLADLTAIDPELAHLKQAYRVEVKAAVEWAMRSLPRAERVLLRRHFLDQLTVDDLARLYRIHRATAGRRVARAKEHLGEKTLAELRERLALPQSELDSILRLVRSTIELSLDRLFQSS
jgi:RNA polymerase sigma-70 factor, ECF subfamily